MGNKGARKELLRLVTDFGTVGLNVASPIFVGVWIGHYLDSKVFDGRTSPWFTLYFLLVGVIAGFRNLYRFVRQRMEEEDKND